MRVFRFPNGREAVAFLKTSDAPIDLLITDVVMPRMQGPELASHVRAARPGTRVLYVTGYTDRIIEPGGHPTVLQKPFGPSGLLRVAREVLDRPVAILPG
jgi:two-component system, cell cycle sensor histidine kinase and response regulator CckA